MDDKQKFQFEGLKWLHEMEFINHPQVVNNIKLNILMTSNRINEVELLIYREKKSILVLLDLTWIGRKFFKKQIFEDVQESLQQLLPSFRFRVIDDPKIMQLAVEKVKQALTGGKNETASNSTSGTLEQSDQQSPIQEDGASSEDLSGRDEDTESSKKEQS